MIRKEIKLSSEVDKITGTLVLDVDGTLTDPFDKYSIYKPVINTLSKFILMGGKIIISTGGTFSRIYQSLIIPIMKSDQRINIQDSLFVIPEFGSSIYEFSNGIWNPTNELHLPNKLKIREILENYLIYEPDAFVAGPLRTDKIFRQYSLGLKNLICPQKTKDFFTSEVIPLRTDINWDDVQLRIETSTLDFCHVKAKKNISLFQLLRNKPFIEQPIYGFGDNGDDFSYVVPTFDVKKVPSEFERRLMPHIKTPPDKTNGEAVNEIINFLIYFSFAINGI